MSDERPLSNLSVPTQQQNNDTKTLIEKLGKRQEHTLKRKRNVVDPKRKLNDIKISMAFLEWYKKVTVNQGGYYDGYKHAGTKDEKMSKAEIVRHQIILTQYWKHKVEEADQMPQKEAVSFRTSWLYAGTNYRRMVEPLDISDYYMRGKRDYINSERSEKFKHYKLMEKWFNDDKKPPSQTSYPNEREKASLTEDSCFWAHVEEAVISFGVLKNGEISQANKNLAALDLIEFEDYVMGLIRNCSVSPEIFLAKSTFMKWWKEYKEYKEGIIGISYNSSLAKFLRDERDGFSHGQDSAWLMVSSDILHNACASICKTTCNGDLDSVCYEVYERVPNGRTIAFRSPPNFTVQNLEHQGKDLVPPSTFGTMFDFIATKVNRSFSIHKAAAEVFSSLHAQLSKLNDEGRLPVL
ncbi:hypothetical protein LguiB_008829 [Lonicera macranthoides]